MATVQSSSGGLAVTFFGTCPTKWEDLNPDQRDSCIAQVQLSCQIEGHYAWVAAGELARQWNDKGYEEYSAVIEYGIGKSGLGRDRIASHELRLLSTTPSRESAIPFVVITSKDIKRAQETVNRLQKHPRLCRYGFRYIIRQGGLQLTAGDLSHTGLSPSRSLHSLCGARIAVHKFAGGSRSQRKNVATIGGVFRFGRKHFALTAAHVFFDNVASTGSWADSGLYVSADSSTNSNQVALQPKVSGSYEIFVESIWHHGTSSDWKLQDPGTSIGLFEPRVPHSRKDPSTATLSEVIWNFEMDWAIFELRDPGMWEPNILQCSSEVELALRAPAADQGPPTGKLLIAAGVSGLVHGTGLGTVGGIKLPWSGYETQAWSIETEIAFGDCGSVVLRPDDGTTYGFIVAHDSGTMITYFIPAKAVLESVLNDCGLPGLPLQDLFHPTSLRGGEMSNDIETRTNIEDPSAPFGQSVGDFIL